MKSTEELYNILNQTKDDSIEAYLREESSNLLHKKRFANYMRAMLSVKGIRQQDLFVQADIPERYGYKLISEEKHTRKRDIILRLCIAGGLSLKETQRALTIYGMADLYPRIPRDCVVIIALNRDIHNVHTVNEMLKENGFEELENCGAGDTGD